MASKTEQKTKNPGKRKSRWIRWGIPGAIVAVALFLLAGYLGKPPAPSTTDPGQVAKFIGSEKFDAFPPHIKQQYAQQIEKDPKAYIQAALASNMPDLEKRRAVHMAMMIQMQAQAVQYYKTPAAQKQAFLDSVINESAQSAKLMQYASGAGLGMGPGGPSGGPGGGLGAGPGGAAGGGPAQPGAGPGGGPGGPGGPAPGWDRSHWSAQQMKQEVENVPTEQKAYFSEFSASLRKRAVERGLPADGPGSQ